MNIKFCLPLLLAILLTGNIYSSNKKLNKLKYEHQYVPVDSTYKKLDSIVIKYWMLPDASIYFITVKKNLLTITNIDGLKRKISTDTTIVFEKYLDDLFVSGRAKTEIGRTYSSRLVFADYPLIEVSLYAQGALHLTHKIYLGMENYEIEFSNTFKNFNKLLDSICQVE